MAMMAQRSKPGEYPLYATRDDCVREWSDRDCTEHGAGGGRIYWRGPSGPYDIDRDGKAHPANRSFTHVPDGSKSVGIARGGFGATGSHYGAGG